MNIQKQVYEKMGYTNLFVGTTGNIFGVPPVPPTTGDIRMSLYDLTTWTGFGLLFNAMKESEDWSRFYKEKFCDEYYVNDRPHDGYTGWEDGHTYLINPTAFLNAVAEFYGLEE